MSKQKYIIKNLSVSLGLNTGLTIIELIVGIAIGSVALVADGFKNLSDSLMLLTSICSEFLAGKNTKRAHVVRKRGAYINAMIIFIVAADILRQAVLHLQHPSIIRGVWVIGVAILAVIINLGAAMVIKAHHQSVTRAAFFGLLSSALSGFTVLISSLLAYFYKIYWVDGAVGILITFVLLYVGVKVFKDARS